DIRDFRPTTNETAQITFRDSYLIPNTPFEINFNPPNVSLVPSDVSNCLNYARGQIASHLQQHGDGPIPSGHKSLTYQSQTVVFSIVPVPMPTEQQLTYTDTLAVLDAFNLTTIQQDRKEQSANIIEAEGGEGVAYAKIARAPNNDRALQLSLPNPYPMAGTPFSLDFHERYGEGQALPSDAVLSCFQMVRHEIVSKVRRHGNRPLASLGYRISEIDLDIVSTHAHEGSPVTYLDFLVVLGALTKKMTVEGFRTRYAAIVMSDGGEFMGDVQVSPGDDAGAMDAGVKSKAET
ncbi:MAG: hypothetical protein Q9207_007233, partial [Kuettlingeria erythrocarpa]